MESMDWSQILERYRHLSRGFQNKIQTIQKKVAKLDKGAEVDVISKDLEDLDSLFQEIDTWIYMSSLEDTDEVTRNHVPGDMSLKSKITRGKAKIKKAADYKNVKIDVEDVEDAHITTYLSFFEQLLSLLLGNALKYSAKSGDISVSSAKRDDVVSLSIYSYGPIVEFDEVDKLTEKGFRARAAIASNMAGDGFGLYNAKRVCDMLRIKMTVKSEHAKATEINNVRYAQFVVRLLVPYNIYM